MNVEKYIKEYKPGAVIWTCPECGKKIGPAISRKKVIEQAKEHASKEHDL